MNAILPSRRAALRSASCGFGYLALAALADEARAAEARPGPLSPKPPHFPARAKRVIFLFTPGAPSHVDTFDPKPRLHRDAGTNAPGFADKVERKLFASPWKFAHHGESGLPVSELLPHTAQHVDKLCVLRGMHTDPIDHPQGQQFLRTGSVEFIRPSVGSWVMYGLGTENRELPGYVALKPGGRPDSLGSAFLPAAYQPLKIDDKPAPGRPPVPHLADPANDPAAQRRTLDLIQALNRDRLGRDRSNHDLEAVIESYEQAFRMQHAAPKVLDLSGETAETLALYGVGDKVTDEHGRRCLVARRLAESGVRFVEVGLTAIPGAGWDQHAKLKPGHEANCRATDKPVAGLLEDLARRGMLRDTLVIWGGEFGRTPWSQGADGRDHNATGYTMWMAGGGVKAGHAYGATDDHGIKAVEGRVHMHDFHATVLHLLGLDHEKLTYRYSGRDFRLTDVAGRVAEEIFA